MARSVRNEHPELQARCLDLIDHTVQPLIGADEPEIVQQGSQHYTRRLVTSTTPLAATAASSIKTQCTVSPTSIHSRLVAQSCSIDLGRLIGSATAQESLARQYLKDAMEPMVEAQVHYPHHRSLWHRWEARLEQEAQPSQLSYQQVVQQFPEVETSLAMLSR